MEDSGVDRVPARAQPGADDLAQHRLRRQGPARPKAARGRGRATRPACWRARRCEPAATRAQGGAGRGERALRRRPAGHRHGPAAQLPPGLRLRPAQLGDHRGARHAGRARARGPRPLRDRRRSRCRSLARRPARRSPSAPRSLPDPRSMFFGLHYSLARLPAEPMERAQGRPARSATSQRPRRLQRRPRAHAAAALREPLAAREEGPDGARCPSRSSRSSTGSTAPSRSSTAPRSRAGVLEWNKAFEKIGFKDAIRVKVQPDDADFDTLDFGRASIRWMTNAAPAFGAIGPSHVDPRSGEILDADIAHREPVVAHTARPARAGARPAGRDVENRVRRAAQLAAPTSSQPARARGRVLQPTPSGPASRLGYALDVLDARGDLDPGSPEARRFVAGLPEAT